MGRLKELGLPAVRLRVLKDDRQHDVLTARARGRVTL